MERKEKAFFAGLLTVLVLAMIIGVPLLIKKDRSGSGTASSAVPSEIERADADPETAVPTTGTESAETEAGTETETETVIPVTETEIPVTESVSQTETETETETETVPPSSEETQSQQADSGGGITVLPWITQEFLDYNQYSRPGEALTQVNNIVIHWVANPGSTAEGNREYFANLQYNEQIGVSSHFIVGLEGEVLYIIPTSEIAYCNYPRNYDTISVEVCHPDWEGKFSDVTYASVIRLSAYLCECYGLTADSLIRHHDVSGKDCPKYYVENEDAWNQLKEDVRAYMAEHPDILHEN